MGPKPIQDVAPPRPQMTPIMHSAVSEPPSGPELVGDIPVHAPEATPAAPSNPDNSFIVSEAKNPNKPTSAPQPAIANMQKPASATKPKPTAAVFFAFVAIICMSVGAYLKFLVDS